MIITFMGYQRAQIEGDEFVLEITKEVYEKATPNEVREALKIIAERYNCEAEKIKELTSRLERELLG